MSRQGMFGVLLVECQLRNALFFFVETRGIIVGEKVALGEFEHLAKL